MVSSPRSSSHERLAVAVQDTLAAAGPVDADRLFAAELDPERLADELRRPMADLAAGRRPAQGRRRPGCRRRRWCPR
ncbi:hypothetical protein ACF061_15575 [Streptomyces sp. NPDC015220]|uniref:NACHT N-terminal Helical domain 1-containing protein n=1 Tax=Streptomyces sp. NPDC015220 TaxID=3364947 RepID=UPI0036FE0D8B